MFKRKLWINLMKMLKQEEERNYPRRYLDKKSKMKNLTPAQEGLEGSKEHLKTMNKTLELLDRRVINLKQNKVLEIELMEISHQL